MIVAIPIVRAWPFLGRGDDRMSSVGGVNFVRSENDSCALRAACLPRGKLRQATRRTLIAESTCPNEARRLSLSSLLSPSTSHRFRWWRQLRSTLPDCPTIKLNVTPSGE